MDTKEYRIERDSMGEVRVPKSAYYGAQTQRAVENFPYQRSGFPTIFIHASCRAKSIRFSVNQSSAGRGSCHRLRRDDYALRPNGEFRIECDDASCYA